jgi:enoyl-CoA hydratase/carnithine racemase
MLTSKYLAQGKVFRCLLKTPLATTVTQFRLFSSTLQESYSNIIVTQHDPPSPAKEGHLAVGLITLNRPKALNALSDSLFDDLIHATTSLNKMDNIGSIVITGKGKAFAAGADIQEMSEKQFSDAYKSVRDLTFSAY